MVDKHALLRASLLMDQVTRGCVEEQEDIRRYDQLLFMDTKVATRQYMAPMLKDYQSHMAAHVK